VEDAKISNGDPLMDEVEINLNMLCALMVGEVDCADVAVNEGSSPQWDVQLQKQLMKYEVILCLNTRTGDDSAPRTMRRGCRPGTLHSLK
jgi:hypothetical protein